MRGNEIALQAVFFLALLLTVSVIDLRTRIIPDTLNVLIALTAFCVFEPWNLLGVFVTLPFLLAAVFCGGMGGGDIKLMAACGVVLGLPYGLFAEILGLFVMLGFYATYCCIQKIRKAEIMKSFPLAPFLSIGCTIAYFIKLGGLSL